MLELILKSASIQEACQKLGITRKELDKRLKSYISERTPLYAGQISGKVKNRVEILRDSYAIPHIYANSLRDLLFGLGFAMGQDRLWQMDVSRRMGLGRLSEIFGRETLESDILARTVGLNRIAQRQEKNLDAETRLRLQAFSNGVNRAIEMFKDKLPIEFEILGYKPEPWSPLDTLAIMRNLWWKLTGRLYVLTTPETAKRYFNDEKLYQAFLQPEGARETIIPKIGNRKQETGNRGKNKLGNIGQNLSLPDEAFGSNNWVVAPKLSQSGAPILASDPHQPFTIPQTWYITHLCGAGINVCGITHPGVPGILMGRNEYMTWGITNNICSLRDLYIEKVNPDNPDQYWNISVNPPCWDKITSLAEEIKVRGEKSIIKQICFTHHGPIVNELLPNVNVGATHASPLQDAPISLRWVGMEATDELTVMFATNKAKSVKEFREALRNWSLPTFNVVFAGREGHIAYQCIGKIPQRGRAERGFRKGWGPEDQWLGYISYDQMPHWIKPDRGWVATANNKVAPDDYSYPLFGTWSSDDRARRIRQMLEASDKHSVEDFQRMQLDVVSLRAVDLLPVLIEHFEHLIQISISGKQKSRGAGGQGSRGEKENNVGNVGNVDNFNDPRITEAIEYLKNWNGNLEGDSVAASIFETFFTKWTERVAKERVPKELVSVLSSPGLASKLLRADEVGWFTKAEGGRRKANKNAYNAYNAYNKNTDMEHWLEAIRQTFVETLDFLTQKFGDKMSEWRWGRLHTIAFKHPLSKIGCLGELFNVGPYPYRGNGTTVQNAGYDSNFNTTGGAEYRQIVDLSDPSKLYLIGCMGQSGTPFTKHYDDQTKLWIKGEYLTVELSRSVVETSSKAKMEIKPY